MRETYVSAGLSSHFEQNSKLDLNMNAKHHSASRKSMSSSWSTDERKAFTAEDVVELPPEGSSGGTGISVVDSRKLAFSRLNNEIWVTLEDAANNRILVASAC